MNPPDEEKKEWGLRTDFIEHKNETLCPPASRLRTAPLPLPVRHGTQLDHANRARGG
jgi:hypothetical protein